MIGWPRGRRAALHRARPSLRLGADGSGQDGRLATTLDSGFLWCCNGGSNSGYRLTKAMPYHWTIAAYSGAPAGNRNRLTSLQGRCITSMLQGQSVLGAGSVNRTPDIRCTKAAVYHWPKPARRTVFRPCETTLGLADRTLSGLAVGTRVRGDDQRYSSGRIRTGGFCAGLSLPGGRGRARCRLDFAPLGAIDIHAFIRASKRPRPL